MIDDPKYIQKRRPSLGQISATFVVCSWVGMAFFFGGLPLAIRAILLFMVPLSFLWLPDLMVKIAGVASRKSLAADIPVSGLALKLVAWFAILGVPIAWLFFFQSLAN